MMGCPGCRYCEWLPEVTRQLHGCPARDVTSAVVQAVQSRKKRRRTCADEERPRGDHAAPCTDAGCLVFCDEYSQSVRAVDAALLCKAGGVQGVLHCMWSSLPTHRRATYTTFARQHGVATGSIALDATAQNIAQSAPQSQSCLKYLSVSQNWVHLSPHFNSEGARSLWLPAMCQHWLDRRSRSRSDQSVSTGTVVAELLRLPGSPDCAADLLPSHLEATDWRQTARTVLLQTAKQCDTKPRGQHADPPFWDWVCGGACHSLAPLYLWIARQAEPTTAWRIISSDAHSTVWDGSGQIFDPIFEAMGIEPTEAFRRAGGDAGGGLRGSVGVAAVGLVRNDWNEGPTFRTARGGEPPRARTGDGGSGGGGAGEDEA